MSPSVSSANDGDPSSSNNGNSTATHRNELQVNGHLIPDYDLDVPQEPPPSYEEVMASNNTTAPILPNRSGRTGRASRRHSGPSQFNSSVLRPYTNNVNSRYNDPGGLPLSPDPSQPFPGSPTISHPGNSSSSTMFHVNPNTPWVYPSSYHCYKCQNTGIKLKNGLLCKDCWQLFGPRSRHVKQIKYLPPGVAVSTQLRAGDPSLGGVLCGACRGVGNIDFLFFNAECPVCHGVGRVLIV